MSYPDRLKALGIPSLKHRRLRGDLIQMYKIKNNIDDLDWNNFYQQAPLNTTRNSENKVFICYSRTNMRKNCFTNRTAPIWNSINPFTKSALTINQFKILIDREKILLDSYYDFD